MPGENYGAAAILSAVALAKCGKAICARRRAHDPFQALLAQLESGQVTLPSSVAEGSPLEAAQPELVKLVTGGR